MSEEKLSIVYNELKEKVTSSRREPFMKFIDFLETETSFLTSPASTKYHLCIPGGLLFHSCNVAREMIKLKTVMAPEIKDETCVIVGLLHDIGKCGMPGDGNEQYIKNFPTEKQEMYGYPADPPYSWNDKITYMEHEDRSLYLIKTYSDLFLTEEEFAAICYHNEPWDGKQSAFKKNKIMTLLQYADYWSALYLED